MTTLKCTIHHINKNGKNDKMVKCQMHKTSKCTKSSCDLPLRMGGPFFGLKTGSRGTPWNSKSAGPGGSENTKCRFWSFIWHFGHFEGGSLFHHFFVTFSGFAFCWFYRFCIFAFCHFLHFLDFLIFVTFWFFVIFTDFMFFHHFSLFFNFSKGILKIRPSFDPFS